MTSSNVKSYMVVNTLFIMLLLAMVIYLMIKKSSFEKSGDEIFSNSSRILISRSTNPSDDEVVLTLRDVHGYFGFANYSCKPSGPVQVISPGNPGDEIGFQETWYRVLLRDTIENTATNIFSMDPDNYTLSLTESGTYFVETMIIVSTPLNYTDTITACSFVDVNGTGLYDVLRRTGFTCDNLGFPGTPTYSPLMILSSTDMFSITTPTKVFLRYLFISDFDIEVIITGARLKLTKI